MVKWGLDELGCLRRVAVFLGYRGHHSAGIYIADKESGLVDARPSRHSHDVRDRTRHPVAGARRAVLDQNGSIWTFGDSKTL